MAPIDEYSKYQTLRGSMFESTCKQEIYMTNKINAILEKNKIVGANSSIGKFLRKFLSFFLFVSIWFSQLFVSRIFLNFFVFFWIFSVFSQVGGNTIQKILRNQKFRDFVRFMKQKGRKDWGIT